VRHPRRPAGVVAGTERLVEGEIGQLTLEQVHLFDVFVTNDFRA
jgi:hypothetical protein